MTSSKKDTFLPLSLLSLSTGSRGDFSKLLNPTLLSTSVSVTTITLLDVSSSCSSSSSSSSGSPPAGSPLLLPLLSLLSPPSQNPTLGLGDKGRERASGGKERERRASLAGREDGMMTVRKTEKNVRFHWRCHNLVMQ